MNEKFGTIMAKISSIFRLHPIKASANSEPVFIQSCIISKNRKIAQFYNPYIFVSLYEYTIEAMAALSCVNIVVCIWLTNTIEEEEYSQATVWVGSGQDGVQLVCHPSMLEHILPRVGRSVKSQALCRTAL